MIFFSLTLIVAMYSVPYNAGQAFAHQSPTHEQCWDLVFNSIYLVLSVLQFVLITFIIILSFIPPPFGPGPFILTNIPPIENTFFILKALSPVITLPAAGFGCDPMIVPPPVTEAGTVHLDCNDNLGFTFNRIENDKSNFFKPEGTLKIGHTQPSIEADSGDRDLPLVFMINNLWPFLSIVLLFVAAIIIEKLTLKAPGSTGAYKSQVKIVLQGLGKSLLLKFGKAFALFLAFQGIKSAKAPGGLSAFSWFQQSLNEVDKDAFTTHAFFPILDSGARVKVPGQEKFNLGKNEIEYFSKAFRTDEVDFPFNVYDNEAPQILFGDFKNVTVEANAHFGFKVNSKTLPLVFNGTQIVDNCDPNPNVDYLGPDFFLLSSLKTDQFAPWTVSDHPPEKNYYALTSIDVKRSIETEVQKLTADDISEPRVAQFNPSEKVEFNTVSSDFSTLKHLLVVLTNSEIKELIQNNTITGPVTADVVTGPEIIDVITNDEIGFIGPPELDEDELSNIQDEDETELISVSSLSKERITDIILLSNADPDVERGFVDKILPGYDAFFYGKQRPNVLGTEKALPNVFVDFQFVTVLDRIPPNILVTEDLAIEVNSTNPASTIHPNVDTCFGVVPNINCQLTIRPPALFDIADPFPTLFENFTSGNGTFNEIEGNLITQFPLGVSLIGWKAVDFSGNGEKEIVFQIVNMKLNGTNIKSTVFDVNATVFSTIPEQITVIANNTDRDPLNFIIEQNPSKGILDTPIDAVFLTKFQLQGAVSKLKGITNEAPSGEIFLTDSVNQRVLMIDGQENLERAFEAPQISSPEAISVFGTNYLISDWSNDKIFEVNNTAGNAITLREIELSGIFSNPKNIAAKGSDIFVTDEDGKLFKITDRTVFSNPTGLTVNGSGSLLVADSSNNRIINFNSSGIFDSKFGATGNNNGQFSNPLDVAIDMFDRIFIVDSNNHRIQKFDRNGNFLNVTGAFGGNGSAGTNSSEFSNPVGLGISGSDIFVADSGNARIQKLDNNFVFRGEINATTGMFTLPTDVAVNSTGFIFVVDQGNNNIRVFNSTLDLKGTITGSLSSPSNIVINSTDHILVTDSANHRVAIFDSDGTFLNSFGSLGNTLGQFNSPTGIFVDSNDNIYVSDTGNNRVQKFAPSNVFLSKIDSALDSRFEGFIQQFDLYFPNIKANALDLNSKKIMIGDWNQGKERVIIANPSGGKLVQHDVSGLVLEPQSLAFNSTNKIFISDSANKTIVILDSTDGTHLKDIDVSNISGLDITPTGVTIASIVASFPGEQLFVYDNTTEKIIAVTEGTPDTALVAFDAKDLFKNLIDISINGTHVFGLDLNHNMSSIVQIRLDKGIRETIVIGEGTTAVAQGKGVDSDLLFFTNKTVFGPPERGLFSVNTTDRSITQVIDFTSSNVEPSGIASNPMKAGLVDVFIENEPSTNMNGPRGLTFSPDNKTFYVSSSTTNEIKVFNATDSSLIKSISDSNLSIPTDLTFGPNGTLFVASYGNNKVLEINVTSDTVDVFAEGANGINTPSGIAITPDNLQIFVSNGPENQIARYHLINVTKSFAIPFIDAKGNSQMFKTTLFNQSAGAFVDFFVNASNSGTLQNPQDITFGPDSNLYVSSFDTNEILVWSTSGVFLGVFGEADKTQSGLDGPSGITFSPDGKLMFVSSARTNQVLQYNGTTGALLGVFSDESTFSPDGLVVGPNSNLFVSSSGSNEVLEYGEFEIRHYISDWITDGNHRILGFDNNGTLTLEDIVNDLALIDPKNIASDSDGRLWIADNGTQKLVKYNPITEKILRTLDLSNIVEKKAPELEQIPDSTMFVDKDGNMFEEDQTDVTTSVNPQGVSLDKNDNIYITDWDNHRIVILNELGTFLGQVRVNSTFTEPIDIAINHTDVNQLPNIWAYDSNFTGNGIGTLVSIDIEKQFEKIVFDKELSPLLRGLDTNGSIIYTTPSNSGSLLIINSTKDAKFDSRHFIIPNGIDVTDPDGIYLTDWKERRIVKLDQNIVVTEEFDFKQVGFPTPDLGDIEVNGTDNFFWITEPRRATIDQVAFDGSLLANPSVADKYVFMSAIDADADDNFYVASSQNDTVSKFDLRGTLLAKANFTLGMGTMTDISLGAVPSNNSQSVFLAVAGETDNKIVKFNSTSLEEQGTSLSLGSLMATSVTVDNDGNIYVSRSNLNIAKFNENFTPDSSILIPSGILGGSISDMVIDSKNNLYATDKNLHRVYKYNLTSGSLVGWLGKCDSGNQALCSIDDQHSKGFVCVDGVGNCINSDGKLFGRDTGQFFEPTALALDGLDNLYVADVKVSRDNALFEDEPDVDFTDVFNRGNVPRVQKFTQDGFFVEQVISDTNKTLVKGNFEWIKGIAYGTNNFYVADVEKLHVFDVNPFSNINLNQITNQTSAEVTYQSLRDIGMNDKEFDSFLYKVNDGFDDSVNIGFVNITIADPDLDNDGIFDQVDTSPVFSSDFDDLDETTGVIRDRGTQILTIHDDRDSEKGVFIQADIRGGTQEAIVNACDNLVEVKLKPGNRLTATCNLGGLGGNEVKGVELDIIRGKIDLTFFDKVGRNSTSSINPDNTIFFSPEPFEFISGSNLDVIKQTVGFNNKKHDYLVPPDRTIRVDTAPPELPETECTTPIILEVESLKGVEWTIDPKNPSDTGLTGQFNKIIQFLEFNATEVDNGNPQETDEDEVVVTNNAESIFQFGNRTVPTQTQIEFFTVDKIGNNATCINTITVRDTTPPELIFVPANPGIVGVTHPFSEAGREFYDVPKIFDLPATFGGPKLEVENQTASCSPVSGSEFNIGNTPIVCVGVDLAGKSNTLSLDVTINPNPLGITIRNVTVDDNSGTAGISDGETITVSFTMPTNKPPVSTTSEINAFLSVSAPFTLGTDVTGEFAGPSNLLITINDASSANLVPNTTVFDLKPNLALKSAAGLLNSSGTNLIPNPVVLRGDFSTPLPHFITAFIADDPLTETGVRDDQSYSVGDTLTIRFSDPTNSPMRNKILNFTEVNSLFNFAPFDLGDDYVGAWKNPSTFIITITEVNTGMDSLLDPILGTTIAKVVGDIKNIEGTSPRTTVISPPLSGSFGEFSPFREIKSNGTFAQMLPSGIIVSIEFPDGTVVGLQKDDVPNTGIFPLSEFLDVSVTNSTKDCVLGCTVTFWIHKSDLNPPNLPLDRLRIFLDNKILVPTVTRISENWISVSTIVNSFSTIGLAGIHGGGGSGGGTQPDIESISITGVKALSEDGILEFGGILEQEIEFSNSLPTAIVEAGTPVKLQFVVYAKGGKDSIAHASLYMNVHGLSTKIHQSDTFVRYEKGEPNTIRDPHGFISDAKVNLFDVSGQIRIVFEITFKKPMEKSDLILRIWDIGLNTRDVKFIEGIEVVTAEVSTEKSVQQKIQLSEESIAKWAGFSDETIPDSEILDKLEIVGDTIPSWYKKIISKWIYEQKISNDDFINALKFFEIKGLL